MKYFLIPYIALGFVLCVAIGLKYDCEGTEMFPTYYGSPFVFMRKSLASSMEFFYSISGLLINVLVWSLPLWGIHILVQKIPYKIVAFCYKILIICLFLFSTLYIIVAIGTLGRGFDEDSSYWYWDIDKEAKDWGMTCKGKWRILQGL